MRGLRTPVNLKKRRSSENRDRREEHRNRVVRDARNRTAMGRVIAEYQVEQLEVPEQRQALDVHPKEGNERTTPAQKGVHQAGKHIHRTSV